MGVQDLNPVDNYLHGSWEALGQGAPVLVALAQLASERWVHRSGPAAEDGQPQLLAKLSLPAQAILYSAKQRGVIEIRAVNSAFDAAARMLAVYVEMDEERTIAFRDPADPSLTLEFLDGFRELCDYGLVMHHIYKDFTLTAQAIHLAEEIEPSSVAEWVAKATEFGIHD